MFVLSIKTIAAGEILEKEGEFLEPTIKSSKKGNKSFNDNSATSYIESLEIAKIPGHTKASVAVLYADKDERFVLIFLNGRLVILSHLGVESKISYRFWTLVTTRPLIIASIHFRGGTLLLRTLAAGACLPHRSQH